MSPRHAPVDASVKGLFHIEDFTNSYQIDIKIGSTAGSCTNIDLSLSRDILAAVKTPVATFAMIDRDNSQGNAVVAVPSPSGTNASLTGSPFPAANITPANGNVVISGTSMNKVEQ